MHAAVVQPVDDVVGDAVALLLTLEDLPGEVVAPVGEALEHVAQQVAGALHVRPRLLEEVVETRVGGAAKEPQAGVSTPSSTASSARATGGAGGSPSGPSAWKR